MAFITPAFTWFRNESAITLRQSLGCALFCNKQPLFIASRKLGQVIEPDGGRENYIMIYYVSKAFWLIAAPTSALVLITAIAALWTLLGSSKFAARVASAAACGLIVGAFTPIGVALTVPLEYRFPFWQPDSRAPRTASSFSRAPVTPGLMRC